MSDTKNATTILKVSPGFGLLARMYLMLFGLFEFNVNIM